MLNDRQYCIDTWIKALEQYNFNEICTKPDPKSWSLGQVCMHLIDQTNYYIEQMKICVSNDENANEESSPAAKTMFLCNSFPNQIIEGPPTNQGTPQPNNKEQLLECLINLKDEINKIGIVISKERFKGKTKHPGLDYFNAYEWFLFGEMHFRHHLRQKERIEDFLKTSRSDKV